MTTTGMTAGKEKYDRDGYAIFRDVLDADLMAEVQEHIQWLLAHHPADRPEFLDFGPVRDDPFWARLVGDDRLLDIASLFVGPEIALFASQYLIKPPGDGKEVLMHQDAAYWPLDPMEVVTLWLACDDVDAENGCMRVVPGSHRMGQQELRIRTDVDNVLSSEIAVDVDEDETVDIAISAGDVEVHHPTMVHGSHPNTSTRRRAGLTIRYIPTTTKLLNPGHRSALLLRGEPEPSVDNYYLPRPRYVDGYHLRFRGCQEWV